MSKEDTDAQGAQAGEESAIEAVNRPLTGKRLQDTFDGYCIALENFTVCAVTLLDDLYPGEPLGADEIAQCLKDLEESRLNVLASVPRIELGFGTPVGYVEPSRIVGYLDPLCELIRLYAKQGTDECEARLLLNAIERAWERDGVLNLRAEIASRPRHAVEWFAAWISHTVADAEELVSFPYDQFPHDRALWLASVALETWQASYARTVWFMECGIDRLIHPRMGTSPDEWTSRLTRVLHQFCREIKPGRKMLRLGLGPCFLDGKFTGSGERFDTLCGELQGLTEQLKSLRFDVECPLFSFDGDSSAAPPARTCRLKADIENRAVRLDGKAFPVPRRSAVYLQAIIDNERKPGRTPISGRAISEQYRDFPANKVSEYKAKLPKEIRALICTSQNGSILHPDAWTP